MRMCTYCGEDIDTRVYFKHIAEKHRPKARETPCDYCGKLFRYPKDVRRHIAHCHDEEAKKLLPPRNTPRQCPECGVSFKLRDR